MLVSLRAVVALAKMLDIWSRHIPVVRNPAAASAPATTFLHGSGRALLIFRLASCTVYPESLSLENRMRQPENGLELDWNVPDR